MDLRFWLAGCAVVCICQMQSAMIGGAVIASLMALWCCCVLRVAVISEILNYKQNVMQASQESHHRSSKLDNAKQHLS